MAQSIQIEKVPEEAGEEIALNNHDDGTISSEIVGASPAADVIEEEETDEREFDKNPTVLYALVQKKLWKETIDRAQSNPKEARAFISRKEKDGKIRWRLLPLHAAIVFKAPEDVIEVLLTSYPKASEAKDDQGMLPLHLAFRNGASAGIVNLLLMAFPQSVDMPDRKNRVPLTLAKASSSPNRDLYITALEKGTSYYSVAALASSRDRIVAEQKEVFEARLEHKVKLHEIAMSAMEDAAEESRKEIQDVVLEKEAELAKLHENSQILVDHVASLEAQMNTRSDTERFLATKIAKLEEKARKSDAHMQERETFWESKVTEVEGELQKTTELKEEGLGEFTAEKAKLNATIEGLTAEINETKANLTTTETKLAESIDAMKEKQDEWDMKEIRFDAKCSKVEMDWANSHANVAILESHLKKRMENEHLLASQVSNLAARLAESADSNLTFSQKLKEFEDQKATLESTVHVLKNRIKNVTAMMEDTRGQQMTILEDAIAQEEMMAKVLESHSQVVSESILQGKEMEAAKEEMMAMVEKSFLEANEKRLERLTAVTGHGQSLSSLNTTRHNVLSCAQSVTSTVIGALEKDLDLDTLTEEVNKLQTERRHIPSDAAEIREEAEEAAEAREGAEEEQPAEESIEEVSSPKAEEATEFIEVISSPKNKSMATIVGDAETTEESPEDVAPEAATTAIVGAE